MGAKSSSIEHGLPAGLGLNGYESRVYLALVELGTAGVRELTEIVSVPRNQVYLALRHLAARGVCTVHRGPIKRFSAVAPSVAFAGVLEERARELAGLRTRLLELDKAHGLSRKEEPPPEFIEVIRGRAVAERMVTLYRQARREILECSMSRQFQGRTNMGRVVRRELAVLRRGVKLRSIYEEDVLRNQALLPHLQKVQQAGEQGRILKRVPMTMVVMDDTMANFSLFTRGEEIVTFMINHPALVAVMREGFENMWARGRELPRLSGRRKVNPTSREA